MSRNTDGPDTLSGPSSSKDASLSPPTVGRTRSQFRLGQAAMSSSTASVTRLIVSRPISVP
jgi:hypothetical protein